METFIFAWQDSRDFSSLAQHVSSRATLEVVRLNLGFLIWRERAYFVSDALRLAVLGCIILLVERSKLMAAMAEPLDSCSA
jgi:hypothetical protein